MHHSPKSAVGKVLIAALLWLVTWSVTHGFFMSSKMQALIPGDATLQQIVATLYILIVAATCLLIFKKYNQKFLTASKQLYAYILPAALLAVMPFHYHLIIPIGIFAPMILVSVFWQDYLTFGLFQQYVQTNARPAAAILTVGFTFTLGHALFFLDSLTSDTAYSWLALLAVGVLFSWIRYRYRTIYLINALHISFLFLFV